MEPTRLKEVAGDPASTPENEMPPAFTGKQFPNKLQFEEAVQRLHEEFEKHPNPPREVFY